MLQRISSRPTHVKELVPKPATTFIGYVNACAFGASGVWLCGEERLHPTVWRIIFPKFVIINLVLDKHPKGTISNSDLEMAG